MRFHADLHVHSKYSRATSRDLDLEHLAAWACRKGIGVVATGDFTHPAWRAELAEKLVPAEPGLYRLRDDIEQAVMATLPAPCRAPVRFMLEVEISTIYKKGERTRKVHHLIYAPDLDTVDRMSARLARIGNIASDGRPILGLDSRNLLEIALESGPHAYLVPAHIWTPWFAALGSQSGFDSIAECYGDLADRIFAVETGLSSDPPMNWRISFLDRYRLTSNSDAHSPGKLGREATTFDCDLDYFAIKHALQTGHGYVGTVEFFPDEGKYHLDGHRKCAVRLSPQETRAHGGRCPVCGEPVTIGVEHRVEALADRSEAQATPPPTAGEVSNLVPLPEILSEIVASGERSRTVERHYDQAIAKLGAELSILQAVPVEDIARAGSTLLAEAITRLRAGKVIRDPGYDGEYGVIRLFEENELKRLTAGALLFDAPVAKRTSVRHSGARAKPASPESINSDCAIFDRPVVMDSGPRASKSAIADLGAIGRRSRVNPRSGARDRNDSVSRSILAQLDDDQRAAAETLDGPLLIVAGPGSGKTRTLTYRVAHLVAERGVAAQDCLAITFTRRAAAEMKERLARLLPSGCDQVAIHTFHSFGLTILREHAGAAGLQRGFRLAAEAERVAALAQTLNISEHKAERLARAISKAKRTQGPASGDMAAAVSAYDAALATRDWIDFDDLIGLPVRALTADAGLAARYRERYRWIAVDEFQDVDEQQYRLLKLLAPADGNLCVIGDPNQAIYGFRGADASCFERFRRDYPAAKVVALRRNYRSTGTIVTASSQVIAARADQPIADMVRDMHERIAVHAAATDRAEAETVVKTIEQLIGGTSLFAIDSGRAGGAGGAGGAADASRSFADFAVLYRTDAQSAPLCEAFARSGIPFKTNSHRPLAEEPAVRALLRELDNDGGDAALSIQLATAAARLKSHAAAALGGALIDLAAQRLGMIAENCGPDRARFLDAVALATDADFFEPRADEPGSGRVSSARSRASSDALCARTLEESPRWPLASLASAARADEPGSGRVSPARSRASFDALCARTSEEWPLASLASAARAERVSLLTLHAAKGLEFPVVFIVGLEDGLLPLTWGEPDEAALAEERRLFYVGMTRAKDRLILSRARQRFWRGRVQALAASPFLHDIENELVKHQRMEAPRRKPGDRQLRLF